jgi:TPR repeat protein
MIPRPPGPGQREGADVPTIHDAVAAFNARNFAAARTMCEQLAAAGEPVAMYLLGRLAADHDSDRPRDPGLAAYWLFKAWQGGVDAETDIVKVRADLEEAVRAGSAVAQNALALILTFGEDAPAAALPWFERAAAQDHPEAVRMLGYLHGEGLGVPKDDAAAAAFYRRAAELGDAFAQFNLAAMLDQGLGGLPRDEEAARMWFRRAAEQGVTAAPE